MEISRAPLTHAYLSYPSICKQVIAKLLRLEVVEKIVQRTLLRCVEAA